MTLRVGILTYDFFPFIGGQGRVTYGLWQALRNRHDIDVTVISPARNSFPAHDTRFPWTQRYGHHPAFSLLASSRIRRWSDELGIDVLHVNGGPGGVMLLDDPAVPVLSSVFHTYEQSARLMPGSRWTRLLSRLERRGYQRASMLIASTESTAASLARLAIQPPVSVIPCGIDGPSFPNLERPRDAASVLFVGRLDRRKNPELVIQAFPRVIARHPNARLVIVGEGPLRRRLQALVDALRLREHVTFEGFVNHDSLVEWYNRATIVVVPSTFEGFGLSAAEAQSCGACVIATDSEGLRDVVRDHETGLLSAPNADDLAAVMSAALADPALRRRLGEHAASHVRASYDWPLVVEQWVAAYAEAVGTSLRDRQVRHQVPEHNARAGAVEVGGCPASDHGTARRA